MGGGGSSVVGQIQKGFKKSGVSSLSIDDLVSEKFKGSFQLPGAKDRSNEYEETPPVPEPEVPYVETAQEAARRKVDPRRKAMARSRSIYTSPLGTSGMAQTIKNYLTGQ